MKVEVEEGFKITLIAESEMERIFLKEWEARSKVSLTDSLDRDCELMDPDFVKWEVGYSK